MAVINENASAREKAIVDWLEKYIFGYRRIVLATFALITLAMAAIAVTGLRIDASFNKLLPLKHPYMQTYLKHQQEFGGANRLLIAVIARDGNMFTPEFFEALKIATDEVFFIKGIERSRVSSLWTPDVRYTEVVEGGIESGDVIPSGFQPTPEGLAQVRENILKANIVGRLVANDFSGALVSAQLMDADPATGQPIDYVAISQELETRVRQRIEKSNLDVEAKVSPMDVHVIGFAKVVGDITEGALTVAIFAVTTVLLTYLFVWIYTLSWKVALIPVVCSVVAVIWQLGILVLLGFGVDPLGILVPFLIFAIGVSHGVQKISAVGDAALDGSDSEQAARRTFRLLFLPAIIALLADLVGFVTILMIPVQVMREMAITASLGVGVVILTDLILLPVLVCFLSFDDGYRRRVQRRQDQLAPLWDRVARIATRGPALIAIVVAIVLGIFGWIEGRKTAIGDTSAGVPELRADSRYNRDSVAITQKFSIGVDIINVIAETTPEACIDYAKLDAIDRFAWHMLNVPGVQDVIALPRVAKAVNAGWNEGSMKWRVLPRENDSMVQSVSRIDTSTGLLNKDCSVMPVTIFTRDHKAETIERIVEAVKEYSAEHKTADTQFRLATGNVGVMAATNEEVEAKEWPILLGVFAAVIVMCLVTFRSVTGTICVVLPLILVSAVLVYAVMSMVGIGLKVSTLPMVALGAGIGVDYGIYLYSQMQTQLRKGLSVELAYRETLRVTGASIVFTGLTLAIGVATWVFSPLKFQADVGVMLTFLFVVNMLGAIFLMPALVTWLHPKPTGAR
jgi:predicted RND superfamily exporter protein